MTEFTNPKSIKFVEHRWRTEIEIVDASGTEHRFVASADAGYTEHDGICQPDQHRQMRWGVVRDPHRGLRGGRQKGGRVEVAVPADFCATPVGGHCRGDRGHPLTVTPQVTDARSSNDEHRRPVRLASTH